MELHCIFVLVLFISSGYVGAQLCDNSVGCYEKLNKTITTCDCCARDNPVKDPCAAASCLRDTSCVARSKACYDPLGFHMRCGEFKLEGQCRKNCGAFKSCKRGCFEVYDKDGCKTCYCDSSFSNPCTPDYNGCNPDQNCILEYIPGDCGGKPCKPFATCKKVCEPLKECPKSCVKYVDSEDCEACHCCNNCVNKNCGQDTKCQLTVVQCFAPPCDPIAKCVPK